MKSKDYMFYSLTIFVIAVLVLTPSASEVLLAPNAPVAQVFKTWWVNGENFVYSMEYAAGY